MFIRLHYFSLYFFVLQCFTHTYPLNVVDDDCRWISLENKNYLWSLIIAKKKCLWGGDDCKGKIATACAYHSRFFFNTVILVREWHNIMSAREKKKLISRFVSPSINFVSQKSHSIIIANIRSLPAAAVSCHFTIIFVFIVIDGKKFCLKI